MSERRWQYGIVTSGNKLVQLNSRDELIGYANEHYHESFRAIRFEEYAVRRTTTIEPDAGMEP